ncbi:3-oxoacyl-[acyl-carrier-protein] reductase FabG [Crateriforma conspicua]|nr:3-oxoacyl-[acyl-carrier-protein] reductase FabG [Crateriforma conspicua]
MLAVVNQSKEKALKVALITGGTRGIGLGIAKALANEGYALAINGMRPAEQVADVLDGLKKQSPAVHYFAGDIASTQTHQMITDGIEEAFGGIHVLVNNAGVAPKERKDLLEADEDSYEFVMGTNLKGPYLLTSRVAAWMVRQKTNDADYQGCIINVGSVSATMVSTNRGDYCLAKAGVGMMTQLFAARMGELNIPVFEVRPGITKTDMTATVTDKYDRLIRDGICVTQRWGYPEDTGRVVASLARGDFAYSTGQVIHVDGGLTIPRL